MAVAGSIEVTTTYLGGGVTEYSVDWTSDASGDVTENTFAAKRGRLMRVIFVPDGGGTQPSDNYDVTLLDENGIDLLGGLGANRSNATKSHLPLPDATSGGSAAGMSFIPAQSLTPTVNNAGNAKGGVIKIYVGPLVLP